MAKTYVKTNVDLQIKITLELDLIEALALNEMVKYGSKVFLEGYYKHLGKSYLQPYEKGVVSLFETVKENLPFKIKEANEIVDVVNEIKQKFK